MRTMPGILVAESCSGYLLLGLATLKPGVESKKGERMIRRIAFLTVVSLILSVGAVYAASSEKEKAAVSSAEKWLRMIDDEKYAESWKVSAGLFRNAVTQEQWEQSLQGVRKAARQTVVEDGEVEDLQDLAAGRSGR